MTCKKCDSTFVSSDERKQYCSKKCKNAVGQHQYYLKHKEEYAKRRTEWRKDNPVRTKYLYAKADIKRRGRGGLRISYEECQKLWNMGCTYCTKDVLLEKGCSLDRINNNLGYMLDNVVTCCGNCNTIKSDILTVDEMKIAMNAVLEHRKMLGGHTDGITRQNTR